MSQQDHYFQFPLCALAYESNVRERLRAIIDYSMVRMGAAFWEKLTPEEQKQFQSPKKAVFKPDDFNPKNVRHWWAVLVMDTMSLSWLSIEEMLERHDRLDSHVESFADSHGGDPLVRIRTDILLDVFNPDSGLRYADLAAYAAIVSAIGSKPYARITRRTILCRMQGYKTAAVRRFMLGSRLDKGERSPLTEKQLRTVLERLHRRKLIAKLNPSRTQAFYSIRMSHDELLAALASHVSHAEMFRREAAMRNARLREQIERHKAQSSGANSLPPEIRAAGAK